MVVDGSAAVRSLVATLVRAAGHGVTVAHSSAEALALVETSLPDLIITDLDLAFVRELRARQALNDTPIMVVSDAELSSEARSEAAQAGANGWLLRPVCGETLERLVGAVAWRRVSALATAGRKPGARAA
jgi:CheY-like chemotaxis protein